MTPFVAQRAAVRMLSALPDDSFMSQMMCWNLQNVNFLHKAMVSKDSVHDPLKKKIVSSIRSLAEIHLNNRFILIDMLFTSLMMRNPNLFFDAQRNYERYDEADVEEDLARDADFSTQMSNVTSNVSSSDALDSSRFNKSEITLMIQKLSASGKVDLETRIQQLKRQFKRRSKQDKLRSALEMLKLIDLETSKFEKRRRFHHLLQTHSTDLKQDLELCKNDDRLTLLILLLEIRKRDTDKDGVSPESSKYVGSLLDFVKKKRSFMMGQLEKISHVRIKDSGALQIVLENEESGDMAGERRAAESGPAAEADVAPMETSEPVFVWESSSAEHKLVEGVLNLEGGGAEDGARQNGVVQFRGDTSWWQLRQWVSTIRRIHHEEISVLETYLANELSDLRRLQSKNLELAPSSFKMLADAVLKLRQGLGFMASAPVFLSAIHDTLERIEAFANDPLATQLKLLNREPGDEEEDWGDVGREHVATMNADTGNVDTEDIDDPMGDGVSEISDVELPPLITCLSQRSLEGLSVDSLMKGEMETGTATETASSSLSTASPSLSGRLCVLGGNIEFQYLLSILEGCPSGHDIPPREWVWRGLEGKLRLRKKCLLTRHLYDLPSALLDFLPARFGFSEDEEECWKLLLNPDTFLQTPEDLDFLHKNAEDEDLFAQGGGEETQLDEHQADKPDKRQSDKLQPNRPPSEPSSTAVVKSPTSRKKRRLSARVQSVAAAMEETRQAIGWEEGDEDLFQGALLYLEDATTANDEAA